MRLRPGVVFDASQAAQPGAAPARAQGSAIMPAMQALRHARFLARLVLAWFVLSLGVAIATPLVQPQSLELICATGGAMKLIVKNADGTAQERGHTLDCPLCATVAAPPPALTPLVVAPSSLAHALQPVAAAHIAARTAAPLPPRGPPALS